MESSLFEISLNASPPIRTVSSILLLVATCVIGSYLVLSATSMSRGKRIWLPKPLHRLRCWLLSSSTTSRECGSKQADRERRAKQSFSVRRTDLAKIARGEPTGRQRKRQRRRDASNNETKKGQNDSSSVSGKARASSSWTECLTSLVGSVGGDARVDNNNISARTTIGTGSARRAQQDGHRGNYEGDDDGLRNVAIMGLDCEMVGAGRDGNLSLLGRCSLVLLVQKARSNADQEDSGGRSDEDDSFELQTIYDKFVRPSKTVTDYRTTWSGITKDDLKGLGCLPCVPFDVCRREVSELLASFHGKPVLLVGHALKNDFEVLHLRHPFGLTRDTATYRQFMRAGRGKRMLQRKLSHLVEEELGMDIQSGRGGHSSVEDAEATLKLYWKARSGWERGLGYPLRSFRSSPALGDDIAPLVQDQWPPLTMYLDGCNLPLGVRCNKQGRSKQGGETTISWQLISKTSTRGTTEVYQQVDWIPILRSALASASPPAFDKIVVMFDGAKYKGSKEQKVPKLTEIYPNMYLESTDVGVMVDDVLVERCCCNGSRRDSGQGSSSGSSGPLVQVDDVIDALSNMSDFGYGAVDPRENDTLDCYAVVRRKGGGTKTNKKLFEKFNLRRPEEGALCLTGMTARLQKNSLQTAKDLQRARVYDLVEYELRSRANVRNIIVTDDILLADRLVNDCSGGGNNPNLVLSWRQLQQMF